MPKRNPSLPYGAGPDLLPLRDGRGEPWHHSARDLALLKRVQRRAREWVWAEREREAAGEPSMNHLWGLPPDPQGEAREDRACAVAKRARQRLDEAVRAAIVEGDKISDWQAWNVSDWAADEAKKRDPYPWEQPSRLPPRPKRNPKRARPNPLRNEHAARIVEPGEFLPGTFRRKRLGKKDIGLSVILAKRHHLGPMEIQAYRFDADKWWPVRAEAWLHRHGIDYLRFEAARR